MPTVVLPGAVIDLGRDPTAGRKPRLPGPRWWRGWGLVVAVAVSATALVAAVPPAAGRLAEVARVDSVAAMRIVDSTLLTVTRTDGPRLSAYRLADGARRWSVALPLSASTSGPATTIGVIDGAAVVSDGQATAAVDLATGRELWHSNLSRSITLTTAHAIVVGVYPVATADGTLINGAPLQLVLRAYGPRTGRQLWEYQVPAGWWVALPELAGGADFVVGSPDGRASTVDLATGKPVASGLVESTGQGQQSVDLLPVYAVSGDQLLHNDNHSVTAYALDTLARAWTVPLAYAQAVPVRCGPWLCLVDGLDVRAVAPDTGAPAWTTPRTLPTLVQLGRWLYSGHLSDQPGDASLLDAANGRVVLDLGAWRVDAHPDAGPVLLRAAGRHPGETWLALLADGPRVEPLGAVTGLGQQPCEVDGNAHLACFTSAGDVRIWRYRR